jgi:adenosylhomocysteinase
MKEAAKQGDFFVTVTGNSKVITKDHYEVMKDGAILANAGHFDIEIDKVSLEELAVQSEVVRKDITQYHLPDGRKINLLAEGRLVNLAAGDGHPAEIMDMTFALQVLSLLYLHQSNEKIGAHVIDVPYEIDEQVSRHFLESLGIQIDELTPEQAEYLGSWEI